MPSLDLCLCSRLVHDGGMRRVKDAGLASEILEGDGRVAYEYICEHIAQYGKIPEANTILGVKGVTIPPLSEVLEPLEFYIDEIKKRRLLDLATDHVQAAVKAGKKAEYKPIVESAGNLLSEIARLNLAGDPVADWTAGTDERYAAYEYAETQKGMLGFPTPWPILNAKTLGVQKTDFWVIAARPGSGKTWVSLKMAQFIWWTTAFKPMYVSMEMMRSAIERRKDAIWAKVPYSHLRSGNLGMHVKPVYKEQLDLLKELRTSGQKGPFEILTRKNVKTVRDIAIYEEELRPDIVFVDGLYKVRPDGRGAWDSHWQQMAALVDQIQELIQDSEIPIVCTTQLSREQVKGKPKGKRMEAGLEHLAFADAIGMNADVIMALLATDAMKSEKKIVYQQLKNREDETVCYQAHFDLEAMCFDEIALFDPNQDGQGD